MSFVKIGRQQIYNNSFFLYAYDKLLGKSQNV